MLRDEARRNRDPFGRSSRARRVFLFLGTVWSIGGALLALEAVYGLGFDLTLSRWIPNRLAMPTQSPAARRRCEEMVKALPAPIPDAAIRAQSKYGAWRLGSLLGFAGSVVSAEVATPEAALNMLRTSRGLTQALGIPELGLPEPGRAAYALRDFSVFLAEDPQCVAAALASRYSPQHSALFKFGAATAIAGFYRRSVPDIGAVFGPQVATYGSDASVRPELWEPLLEARIPVEPGADLKQSIEKILNRIDLEIKTFR